PARGDRNVGVVEDHQVQVDEGGDLGGGGGRDALAQFLELRAHLADGGVEARAFLLRPLGRYLVARHVEPGVAHQVGVPDGDAAGDTDAVDGEAHSGRGP